MTGVMSVAAGAYLRLRPRPCDQSLSRSPGCRSAAGRIWRQMESSIFSSLNLDSHTPTHLSPPPRPTLLTLQHSSFLCKDKTRDYFRCATDARMLVLGHGPRQTTAMLFSKPTDANRRVPHKPSLSSSKKMLNQGLLCSSP